VDNRSKREKNAYRGLRVLKTWKK